MRLPEEREWECCTKNLFTQVSLLHKHVSSALPLLPKSYSIIVGAFAVCVYQPQSMVYVRP